MNVLGLAAFHPKNSFEFNKQNLEKIEEVCIHSTSQKKKTCRALASAFEIVAHAASSPIVCQSSEGLDVSRRKRTTLYGPTRRRDLSQRIFDFARELG